MSTDDFINMNITPSDNMINIVKNFNPFEILQPTKPEVAKENLLVDLSDDQPKKEGSVGIDGSLLDRTTKSEFDVVDLFQNIFINPEHVSKNVENPKQFNDKDKDWIKDFESIDYVNDVKVDILEDLTSIFTEPLNANASALDDDGEDKLLDEVLAMKRMEKELLGPHHRIHFDNQIESDVTVTLGNVYTVKDRESGKFKDNEISDVNKPIAVMEPTRIGTLPDDIHRNACYKTITERAVQGIDKEIIKISNPICMIQAVKLDKKKYQKRQMLSDEEKTGYTRGPDLIEKSIALPTMIERIKARRSILQEREGIRHRLVVGPDIHHTGHEGTSKNLMANIETPVSFNPIMLTDNCNRDRLIAWETARAFEKFVLKRD